MSCIDRRQRAQFITASKSPSGPEHCIDASVKAAQRNFDRAFVFDLNPSPLREDISVTARARFAQRTGFYARSLDALALSVDDSISSSIVYGTCISMPSMLDDGCYTQNLKSVAYLFSPHQHARCIPRTRPHTHVCFERATTEVENTHWTP